jgi:hypothetical protein
MTKASLIEKLVVELVLERELNILGNLSRNLLKDFLIKDI